MTDNIVPFGQPGLSDEERLIALEHASPFVARLYDAWEAGDADVFRRVAADHPEALLWMMTKLRELGWQPPAKPKK